MDNPLIYRAIERVAIVIAATVFAYLGYRLFVLGHTKGPGRLQTKSRLGEIIVSGTGPGAPLYGVRWSHFARRHLSR